MPTPAFDRALRLAADLHRPIRHSSVTRAIAVIATALTLVLGVPEILAVLELR